MEQKIVLTGIARSKGKAAGEALVNRQRMGWAWLPPCYSRTCDTCR